MSKCPECGASISEVSLKECPFCRKSLSKFKRQDDFNPFQAPEAESQVKLSDATEMLVEGKFLVVRSGAVLPPFCVKTNAPLDSSQVKKRTVYWCSRYVYLLILINLIILAIVYFIVRKKLEITYGVSPEYIWKTRKRRLIICALIMALPIAGIASGGMFGIGPAELVIISIVPLAIMLVVIFNINPVNPTRYENGQFWIGGLSEEFLARIKATQAA